MLLGVLIAERVKRTTVYSTKQYEGGYGARRILSTIGPPTVHVQNGNVSIGQLMISA